MRREGGAGFDIANIKEDLKNDRRVLRHGKQQIKLLGEG